MAVKNNDKVSKPITLHDVVLQGDTMAPILASADMDCMIKDWVEYVGEKCFKYKGEVAIPALGMMDDLLVIAEVGAPTTVANAFFNTSSAIRGLHFNAPKCNNMVVSNKKVEGLKNIIKVDNWVEDRVNNTIEDTFMGKSHVKDVNSFKYMGTFVQSNAGNDDTISYKIKNAYGTINKIKTKVQSLNVGRFRFEMISILRDSVLMGSMLYGIEVLSNWKKEDTRKLERMDALFLNKSLDLDCHTPYCLPLLEMGLEPIHVKITKKRVMFLKYVLDNKDDFHISSLRSK